MEPRINKGEYVMYFVKFEPCEIADGRVTSITKVNSLMMVEPDGLTMLFNYSEGGGEQVAVVADVCALLEDDSIYALYLGFNIIKQKRCINVVRIIKCRQNNVEDTIVGEIMDANEAKRLIKDMMRYSKRSRPSFLADETRLSMGRLNLDLFK